MSKIRLTLSDPVQAQEQTFEIIKQFKLASEKDKRKIKHAVLLAIRKAQSSNNTFVASLYRQTIGVIEELDLLNT